MNIVKWFFYNYVMYFLYVMQVELNKDNLHGGTHDKKLAIDVLRKDLANYDISRAKLVFSLF